MRLGAFSISLAVKDIAASKAFYEGLGFVQLGGDIAQNWCILKNETAVIGLFQGMFDKNTLTFNPGWDQSASPVDGFTDVRDIQTALRAAGMVLDKQVEPGGNGPDHIILTDPDGNPVLIDQHV